MYKKLREANKYKLFVFVYSKLAFIYFNRLLYFFKKVRFFSFFSRKLPKIEMDAAQEDKKPGT